MTISPALLPRVDRKTVIITLAGLLLCFGLIRFAIGIYQEKSLEIEAQEAILFAQQKSSRQLPSLKKEMALLEGQEKRAAAFLFHGPNADAITSTMQIRLQSLIAKAGLEPESLRPLGGKSHDSGINTISIKLRLNGSLENLGLFLAALYKNDTFFLLENCTIKPDKTKGLKIFMDLKAFYNIQQKQVSAKTSGMGRGQ